MTTLTVALLGANGQLGQTLRQDWASELAAGKIRLVGFDRTALNISEVLEVDREMSQLAPDLIINAAAYTAVDRAESEADIANAVNRDGAGNVARWVADNDRRLLHISTDFVFDGSSPRARKPTDAANPLNVYGSSKLAGEQAIQASGARANIIRTGWLYSACGSNFVITMLRLMREKDSLQVVVDQIGTPTSCHSLADFLFYLIHHDVDSAVYHWSDAGVASWYDFAVAIQEEALEAGLLDRAIPISPVTSDHYPTPARRPASSVLDKTDSYRLIENLPLHWRTRLRRVIQELRSDSQPKENML